jgi:pimeloyl-ACP methyl ester carboxylesterase
MPTIFSSIQSQYDELWKAIIRPPRDIYQLSDLGPKEFMLSKVKYKRTDLVLVNERGLRLQCSHFEPVEIKTDKIPCVIYMHGNCSSRCEALPQISTVLGLGATLFCFDFSGSGLSDGEWVSLGFYEKDDLKCVIEYLRSLSRISRIALWGRSMGAATALLHVPREPSLAGIVLDSPFSDLRLVADELAHLFLGSNVPGFILSLGISMVRSSIKSRAQFDIDELSPISHVSNAYVPALFAAADQDTFIKPEHGKTLFEKYAGDKNFILVPGDHNSPRPRFFQDSVFIFLQTVLNCGDSETEKPVSNLNGERNLPRNGIPEDSSVDFAIARSLPTLKQAATTSLNSPAARFL